VIKKLVNIEKKIKNLYILCGIILITFFVTIESQAELIKPSYTIEPYQVVKIQLRSLKNNDNPTIDNGIEQTWQFAHPNNQKNTGPLVRFKNMIKGKSYEMLLNHLDHKVVEIESNDLKALFEVTVLDKDKAYYKFNWTVEKYNEEGLLKGCWLTTMVSKPKPLGSSI
tara:strand:+ start:1096 stop:1599 length:504 start_codon:yes stop_codon:yes gene_type:complete